MHLCDFQTTVAGHSCTFYSGAAPVVMVNPHWTGSVDLLSFKVAGYLKLISQLFLNEMGLTQIQFSRRIVEDTNPQKQTF